MNNINTDQMDLSQKFPSKGKLQCEQSKINEEIVFSDQSENRVEWISPPPYTASVPNVNDAVVFYQPQRAVVVQQPYVPDNLIWSIISLFFCLLTGLVALSLSMASRRAKEEGNYQEAKARASSAKSLAIVSIIIGILIGALSGIIIYVTRTSNKNTRETY
ncbi:DgyrCDS14874 [Dimorphilus gyrociliatus]|uniref:DgyrCDS14873 n=1 Tax=Dimorphilus gyrociliatus TaxID=2664684 RepID=A0A7I8WFB3_9ANNE|nr:DgyrCDS14873 [Dimorphilus gyrociliatus]CAD5126843.1 DgyrCDS14874 [Dimorphilus gyrociliatus]